MNYDVYCVICRQKLLSGNDTIDVIRERGLKTMKTCSAAKRDGLEELFGGLTNIKVHSKCRKYYTRKRSLSTNQESSFDFTSPAKRTFCEQNDNPEPSTSFFNSTLAPLSMSDKENIIMMPSSLPADKCFFCNERITNLQVHNELKKPLHKRNSVFTVRDKTTKTSIIKAACARNDEFGKDVLNRIENVDLVEQKYRYHRHCYKQFFYKNKEHDASTSTIGRPKTEEVSTAMESIFVFIENHQNNCQFSLKELRDVISDKYVPHDKTIKEELKKKYGNNIVITNLPGRTPIITFKDDIDKIIYESWSQTKKGANDDIATVLKAAEIVRKDIRSKPYETEFYPSPHAFLGNAEKDVPDSLLYFLQTVTSYDRKEDQTLKTKILSIAHAIIAATRPRSFISCIFTALSTFLNKNFGSKKLISILASLGFCSSYYQCNEFDASCASHSSNVEVENNFVQFVFDNADANIGTLDGLNTFHAMGGIQVLTPGRNMIEDFPIQRVNSTTLNSDSNLGQIPLQHFSVVNNNAQSEKMQDMRQTTSIEATNSELIWAIARFQKIPDLPGWNGYMHNMTKQNKYDKSEIVPLPFINASPSDKVTIYTAIIEAVKRLPPEQKSCILTFDQPLYSKAREIVIEANLQSSNNIVVRLGGFHLLMSFMGSIGFIMAGSGLQELWKLIYASASTDQMMTGHAYSRAIRAHFLTQEALYHIIFSEIEITSENENAVADFFVEIKSLGILQEDPQLIELITKTKNKIQNVKQNGPTAQLWVQYIELVTLIRQFIEAERTGNWKLHIDTIAKMIPIFAAAGHYHYTKSAQLYLKDMSKLKEVMTVDEYEKFTTNGYFTIRRSDRFWSGLWSDLTIEQTLMRNIKSPGGLTTGRGMSENVLAKWISAMPIANRVIENFFVFTNSNEEECELSPVNADSSKSRILRDANDLKTLVLWLNEHPPFQENDKIISLSTGVVGDTDKINCHKAGIIGAKIIDETIDKELRDVKFRRKDRVVPLAAVNSAIKVKDVEIPIEPLTLFQRISYAKKSQEELQEFFRYELAPYPLSLFDEHGMRKGKKSSMYDIFTPLPDTVLGERRHFVVDGGHLLHKVVWHKGDTVDNICKQYTEYIKKHYGTEVSVVFDGYPEDLSQSTKTAERSRRAKKPSAEIIFDPTTAITTTQDIFLQNSRNKARLVTFLEGYFNEEGIEIHQAKEDADYLIVATALEKAKNLPQTSAIIVGEDIDLLVIMTETVTTQQQNVFFLKPAKGNAKQMVYGSDSLSAEQYNIKNNILFLHAISGCDTTSALYMQGKKKFANVLAKHPNLSEELQVFKHVDANIDHLHMAGQKFIIALYGGRDTSLNLLRYKMFTSLLLKTKSNLASLPPTEAAANQHILRTYLQVQKWLTADPDLLPTNFGWTNTSGGLTACRSILDPAPQELLRLISCKCKTGCERANCSCKKAGLKCSIICGVCSGQSCTNTDNIELNEDDQS